MYTDNNKLVLAVGDIYKLVYYHDKDGKITNVEHYSLKILYLAHIFH